MQSATMTIHDVPMRIDLPPNQDDKREFDPDTNPEFDVSSNFFVNKKIGLLRWALTRCNQFTEIDRLVDIAKSKGVYHQVNPEARRANKRVTAWYGRQPRFTNGSATVVPVDRRTIAFCESVGWSRVI